MADRWRSQAYGLALEGDPGELALPSVSRITARRRTVLRAVDVRRLDAEWPSDARRLAEEHAEPGAPPRTIDEHPTAGWRLAAPGWGHARVAADGTAIDCAREAAAAWRWQRFLVGRALPFAAVAAGLEVLHAAAVDLGGAALALTGPSGAGKSSVAAALSLRGLPLLTDDVLALELTGAGVTAHPGPPVLALREPEVASLGPGCVERLGAITGTGGGKTYVTIGEAAAAVPLGRVAILRRSAGDVGLTVHHLRAPGPRDVLGALFVPEVRIARRLRAQLDLLAVMTGSVAFLEVVAGIGVTADDVAGALTE